MIYATRSTRKPMTLKTARIMWGAFVISSCLIVFVSHTLMAQPHQSVPPAPSFVWILAAIAAVDIVVLGAIRRNFLAKSQEQSTSGNPDKGRAIWGVAQILGFAGAQCIVLFGFVLSVMRVQPSWAGVVFYVAGLAMFLGYWPRSLESEAPPA